MRLIDADDFKKFIKRLTELGAPYEEIIKLLDQQPTVEIPSFNILQDKTLVIDTDLYPKVGRVFVGHEELGTFFYSDGYERPKGKWILKEYYIPVKQTTLPTVCKSEYKFSTSPTAVESKYMYICPYCKKEYTSLVNYCSNCGAEMEVEE